MNNKPASSRSQKPDGSKPFKKEPSSNSKPGFRKTSFRQSDSKPEKGNGGSGTERKEERTFKPKSTSGRNFSRDNKEPEHPKKNFRKEKDQSEKTGDRKPFREQKTSGSEKRPFATDKKPFDKEKKPFNKDRKPFNKEREAFDKERKPFNKERKPFDKERKPFDKKNRSFDKEKGSFDREKKPFAKRIDPFAKEKKPIDKDLEITREVHEDRVYKELPEEQKPRKRFKGADEKAAREREDKTTPVASAMTLNKFIAHSGECSRRDAAELVKQGKVRVNGELVLEPGYRIEPGDQVTLLGKKLTPQKGLVYILLNKPKGYITTTEDPQERKTVMELVANAGVDRLFPVGRLDRNTTGLLLITNDGTLTHKLSHPSYNIKKVYQVTLDKNLTNKDYQQIVKGVQLEDGLITVDAIAYLEQRNELGLEIHSGRNRIVRRIFESLGYEVEKLDRVMYAGLTKKNLPRGKWRFLNEKEIILLKHFKN